MRMRLLVSGLVACGLVAALSTSAGTIDLGLQEVLEVLAADEVVSTLVYVNGAADLDALTAGLNRERATLQHRHATVVRALQQSAELTQQGLRDHLDRLESAGRIRTYDAYWIYNIIRVDATRAEILQLVDHPLIRTIYYNYEVTLDAPRHSAVAPDESLRTPEPGLVAIRAPEVWALGIDGTGVLVSHMDTGVDGNHPALASRWAGTKPEYQGHPQWAWHDSLNSPPSTFPSDGYGHGTHTMGTICGGSPGNQVGVAPGAYWIADNCINQGVSQALISDVIAALQWLADPDGNPSTVWDVPAVCSHSWGLATYHNLPPYTNPCDATFWYYLDACEAAGCVVLFSAGNEGPSANTLRRPADRATDAYRTVAVAAVDGNTGSWPIASFSSRGPTNCAPGGGQAIKPDISAPGVNVRSAYPGGGYQYMDGTSMASPHVNGVVALMRQACPDLPVQTIKEILYNTAYDLGTAGEDNSYGWGMVDAYEAVLAAQNACGPHPPHANNGAAATPIFTPVTVALDALDDGLPNPPGVMSFIIKTLPARGYLTDPNGGVIGSAPYTLAGNGNQVIHHPEPYYNGPDGFTFAATDGGTPPDGGESNVASVTLAIGGPIPVYSWDMNSNPGWTISGGQWAYGHPTGSGGEYGCVDPNNGYTGTNVYGYNLNGDYANNIPEYHLTTTALDCSGLTQVSLRFWRWLGVEQPIYDHAYVRVSTNGTTWATVWENPSELTDCAWTQQTVDISAQANNQSTVYVRWTMGATDVGWRYCGWNIDDVEVLGLVPSNIRLGDLNCDGTVDFDDIDPFVLILSDQAAWQALFPTCDWHNGDCNGDGAISFGDIDSFVGLLTR